MLSYVEGLSAEYNMDPHQAFHALGTALGFGLIEARSSRMGLSTIDYIDRSMIAASLRCRKHILENFIIED